MARIIEGEVSYSDSECLYLDLNVVSILGFHNVDAPHLESIIKCIKEGAEFPPVFLVPVEPNELVYRLTILADYHIDSNFGGHHRAVAHYIENKLMKCLILKPSLVEPYDCLNGIGRLFPIEDTIIE